MFRLDYGRSYMWLFAAFVAAIIAGAALAWANGTRFAGTAVMPVGIAIVLSCELPSGIALDSWCRAAHRNGSWQYTGLIAWHALAVVLFSAMSYFFITHPPSRPPG